MEYIPHALPSVYFVRTPWPPNTVSLFISRVNVDTFVFNSSSLPLNDGQWLGKRDNKSIAVNHLLARYGTPSRKCVYTCTRYRPDSLTVGVGGIRALCAGRGCRVGDRVGEGGGPSRLADDILIFEASFRFLANNRVPS